MKDCGRLVCESVLSDAQHLPEGIPLHFFALQGSNLLMHTVVLCVIVEKGLMKEILHTLTFK